MKQTLLTFIIALLAATGAWAQTTFTVNNLKYTVTDAATHTVELTGYETEPEGALTIPATVTNESTEYSVTSIGNKAFYNCKAITAVTIPSSVTDIGDWAFYLCNGITEMTVAATVPPTMVTNAFTGVSQSIPVYVPLEALDAYKAM